MEESAAQKRRVEFTAYRRYRIKAFAVEVMRRPGDCSHHIDSAEKAARLCRFLIPDDDREHFGVFCLNNKNRLIRYHEVSVGSLDSCLAHPREVFRALILTGSAGFICVHNHPSGDPAPSPEDLAITSKLQKCADIFAIRFLDHVIIGSGNDRYYSFSDEGILSRLRLESYAQAAERPPSGGLKSSKPKTRINRIAPKTAGRPRR